MSIVPRKGNHDSTLQWLYQSPTWWTVEFLSALLTGVWMRDDSKDTKSRGDWRIAASPRHSHLHGWQLTKLATGDVCTTCKQLDSCNSSSFCSAVEQNLLPPLLFMPLYNPGESPARIFQVFSLDTWLFICFLSFAHPHEANGSLQSKGLDKKNVFEKCTEDIET